jgi:hypothetical protein
MIELKHCRPLNSPLCLSMTFQDESWLRPAHLSPTTRRRFSSMLNSMTQPSKPKESHGKSIDIAAYPDSFVEGDTASKYRQHQLVCKLQSFWKNMASGLLVLFCSRCHRRLQLVKRACMLSALTSTVSQTRCTEPVIACLKLM